LEPVRVVLKNFVPVVIGRGVVQISAYIDSMLASLLPSGALSALSYAQTIYLLPVSLFGMSVSAAELPEMSRVQGSGEEVSARVAERLRSGFRRMALFVIPTAVAYILVGDVVVALLYQWGAFKREDTVYVWMTLAASAVGLLPVTWGRLCSSAFYSLKDTRTPLRFALIRVGLATACGIPFSLYLPGWCGLAERWGLVGLTGASALAAVLEYCLLRRALEARVGRVELGAGYLGRVWVSALCAGGCAVLVRYFVGGLMPTVVALAVLFSFAATFIAICALWGVEELFLMARSRS
jgi:putative peptidoglycan lipid II flippase